MRRTAGGLLAFLVMTGVVLALPVSAAPSADAEPVAPSIDEVSLGSVEQPEAEAVVTEDGTVVDAGPDAGVAPDSSVPPPSTAAPAGDGDVASSGDEVAGVPALTVSRPDTARFSTVGVTWARDEGVTGVTVQLRTKDARGTWSRWTELEADDVEIEGAPAAAPDVRGGTAPYWTDEAYGVEVIVQAADGSTPRDVQVQLIDPGTSEADAMPGAPSITDQAHAADALPAIYSRAQWGADESLMGWDHEYAPKLLAATVHHTADSNSYSSDDVPRIMRSIYAYHAVSRGWGDIGYHVIVDKFGRAWEGRSGGLASTVIGAHAGGFNTGTFGISMLGNYDVAQPPRSMIETVGSVVAWKLALHGVDPRGKVSLTSKGGGTSRYPAGESVTLPTIFGHRDVGATACPGRYGYGQMGEIRNLAAARASAFAALIQPPSTMMRNSPGTGAAEWETRRGDRGDQPVACDWDGTGNQTVGIFRAGRWFLFDSNSSTAGPSAQFGFGDPGDTPICGDWDGDGRETVGIWRGGWFYLKNSNTGGVADGAFPYGNRDAQPVVGDWNGDGFDTVAVYQNGAFHWADSNLQALAVGAFGFGDRGDRVVVGDWTGSGRDSMGVWRRGTFFLSTSLGRPRADQALVYGDATDRPIVADWDGNGTTTLGVTRGY
ncbi:N-acetylmuramoyl-L-alanine amidase [Geodermatophilus sp. YIM 151500]|uniref:N-acetylmuramoyl-L-alanine amidase n=1 Tax=Geodermatophilus sp. YIM 151500 TaxID=2984531 RepID=UPI0021E3B989|nr:N-acetylmuramoyl-L-alanine amidase [Geodermatophilus sp. YIM 151500]MCV2488569.1 N-acetylmuramoyl-L-alanine amidase [Geodermatophilus sp. YIM 151500]